MPAATSEPFYLFDSIHYEPFELGAKLHAILAYPSERETELRHQAFEALCAQTIHVTCEAYPSNSAWWRARYPAYAAISAREIRPRLRMLDRRLRHRETAAQIALGYFDGALRRLFALIGEAYPDLQQQIGDIEWRRTPLPDGVPRHSLNALIQFHYPHCNEEGCHNREHRIWRSSLPVIHLAVAFHVVGSYLKRAADTFEFRLDDLNLYQRILRLAEAHETAVECEWEWWQRHRRGGNSTFRINPGVLIRCRAEKPATLSF
jgi:hypothetical protein